MTPCAVCAAKGERTGSSFWAFRGENWPVTQVAGLTVHKSCAHEVDRHSIYAETGDVQVDDKGVARWRANGSVIPDDSAELFELLGLPGLDVTETAIARDAETALTLAAYRARRDRDGYSAEELAGMRAAFGEGADIVDVITGKKVRL